MCRRCRLPGVSRSEFSRRRIQQVIARRVLYTPDRTALPRGHLSGSPHGVGPLTTAKPCWHLRQPRKDEPNKVWAFLLDAIESGVQGRRGQVHWQNRGEHLAFEISVSASFGSPERIRDSALLPCRHPKRSGVHGVRICGGTTQSGVVFMRRGKAYACLEHERASSQSP